MAFNERGAAGIRGNGMGIDIDVGDRPRNVSGGG